MKLTKTGATPRSQDHKTSPFVDIVYWILMALVGLKFVEMTIVSSQAPMVLFAAGSFLIALGATWRKACLLEQTGEAEVIREGAICIVWVSLAAVIAAFVMYRDPAYDQWMRMAIGSLLFPAFNLMKSWVR